MNNDDIADRNVEQLNFTAQKLGDMERQRGLLLRAKGLPGSRSDGGMAHYGQDHATINDLNNPQDPTRQSGSTKDLLYKVMQTEAGLRAELAEAIKLIEKLESDLLQREDEIIGLKDTVARETSLREHFESMLRQIATLVVNGTKDKPA